MEHSFTRFQQLTLALAFLILTCTTAAFGQDVGPAMPPNRYAAAADWWKHAVFYEIYPRSYGDTNNDGEGDLNGITQHLDHLQRLGVDAIWITPMYPSPQVDFGYDVSDYRNVAPEYGTLADFDRLVQEGKRRGIKVILDLVVNHSSDQHKWFLESKKSKDNPFRDYYIWRNGHGPGQPPNNWSSLFGGPAWEYNGATEQYYYHYFYPQQPDLNWRNPKVEREMFDIMRFWFQRGVYGFRLDAVDALFEDPQLQDNPPAPGVDSYGMSNQQRIHNANLPEVHTELQKMRQVADQYQGRILIGETWTSTPAELAVYYGPKDNELQMPMYFNFTTVDRLSAADFRQKIDAIEHNTAGGWPVYVLSNHDIARQVERYTPKGGDKDKVAKLLAGLLLTLRGTPILYYGDEIGMQNNNPTRREDVKDIIGQKGWPAEKGRDGERTPMQWDSSINAGFDGGAKPWLPVHPGYSKRNVAAEMADKNSVLNWYRQLIRLRRENMALVEGDYVPVSVTGTNVLAYLRRAKDSTALIILNMEAAEQTVGLDSALAGRRAQVLASTGPAGGDMKSMKLGAFDVVVAQIE